MRTVISLGRLRRFTIVRIAATMLVVLTVSPFTAPFSTIDLAELAGETPLHGDLLSSAKTVKDASVDDLVISQGPLVSGVTVLPPGADSSIEHPPSMPLLVLRL